MDRWPFFSAAVMSAVVACASALAQAPAAVSPAPGCATCGVVTSVRYVEKKGQSSGAGAVVGGIVGGVLGHQIGSGRGNTAATIAGAGVGAYAGNEVEKNRKKKAYYVISVQLDHGGRRSFTQGSNPPFREGDRVKIVDGNRLALIAQ
ncbi:MAG TPA: glycine zipper 2TM domain-containing protein [Casimicrobiaceae bacterium]|nr:glycine zipper 2TM domain-containing protein [Casimicrobiaceae bacterium]